ncbi:MAG: type II toxin-antitoxin system VapC family toxin [Symploca sp. SIO2B6]|nr:type II toxin-antitoxin system VapC family toxin [Symploca sp. SIO2B6]
MSRVILLDAGPLGLVTNPKRSERSQECTQWLQSHLNAGSRVIVTEIADYEIRRELLRVNKTKGLERLDALNVFLEYLPLTTEAMRESARLWAYARQTGQPTAADNTIDADMILIAQARTLGNLNTVIATTNVKHLPRFTTAKLWLDIYHPLN